MTPTEIDCDRAQMEAMHRYDDEGRALLGLGIRALLLVAAILAVCFGLAEVVS